MATKTGGYGSTGQCVSGRVGVLEQCCQAPDLFINADVLDRMSGVSSRCLQPERLKKHTLLGANVCSEVKILTPYRLVLSSDNPRQPVCPHPNLGISASSSAFQLAVGRLNLRLEFWKTGDGALNRAATCEKDEQLRSNGWIIHGVWSGLTEKVGRAASATLPPGSLQRMVRWRHSKINVLRIIW